jgi:hypothetical protein
MSNLIILSSEKKEEILYNGATYTRTEKMHSEGYITIRWTEGIQEMSIYDNKKFELLESEYQTLKKQDFEKNIKEHLFTAWCQALQNEYDNLLQSNIKDFERWYKNEYPYLIIKK